MNDQDGSDDPGNSLGSAPCCGPYDEATKTLANGASVATRTGSRAFCWYGGSSPCNADGIPDPFTCYTLCLNDATCAAAEFHVAGNRCELWSGSGVSDKPLYYDIDASTASNYQCHIKNTVDVASETLASNPGVCIAAPT